MRGRGGVGWGWVGVGGRVGVLGWVLDAQRGPLTRNATKGKTKGGGGGLYISPNFDEK